MLIYKNIPNLVSILGVLPLALLLREDGFPYLVPLLLYNNVMDDLDGILATKLNLRSPFGAVLDNVCEAVSHILGAMAVGMHYGGLCAWLSLIAAVSILVRVVSRLNSTIETNAGSPTNELMRHIFFAIVVTQFFEIAPEPYLATAFALNAIAMQVPYPLRYSIRSLAKSATAVIGVNVALATAWWVPMASPLIAACFVATFLYSLVTEGLASARAAIQHEI